MKEGYPERVFASAFELPAFSALASLVFQNQGLASFLSIHSPPATAEPQQADPLLLCWAASCACLYFGALCAPPQDLPAPLQINPFPALDAVMSLNFINSGGLLIAKTLLYDRLNNLLLEFWCIAVIWYSFRHSKAPHLLFSISYCLTNGVQFILVRAPVFLYQCLWMAHAFFPRG